MTQALDMDERISELGGTRAAVAPASTTRARARASSEPSRSPSASPSQSCTRSTNGRTGRCSPIIRRSAGLDFWRKPGAARGWPAHVLVRLGRALRRRAAVVGWIATMVSDCSGSTGSTTFCCVLAALWPACFALAGVIDERASFNAEFLRSVWASGIPALVGAAVVTYLVSSRWARARLDRLVVVHADRRARHPRLLAQYIFPTLAARAVRPT